MLTKRLVVSTSKWVQIWFFRHGYCFFYCRNRSLILSFYVGYEIILSFYVGYLDLEYMTIQSSLFTVCILRRENARKIDMYYCNLQLHKLTYNFASHFHSLR